MKNMVEIRMLDITKATTDCIVNAANSGLWAGGGVCGAIFRVAGMNELQAACNAIGGCETGSAVITPAFRLPCKYVIHAVGPQWHGGKNGEPEQLYGCYQRSMELVRENGCHSITFPLISAGIYGYPLKEAWAIAIRSVRDFQNANADDPISVTFAVIDERICAAGKEILHEIIG